MNRKSFFKNIITITASTVVGGKLDWIPEPLEEEPLKPGIGGTVLRIKMDENPKHDIWMPYAEYLYMKQWEEERQKKLAAFMWGNYQHKT